MENVHYLAGFLQCWYFSMSYTFIVTTDTADAMHVKVASSLVTRLRLTSFFLFLLLHFQTFPHREV